MPSLGRKRPSQQLAARLAPPALIPWPARAFNKLLPTTHTTSSPLLLLPPTSVPHLNCTGCKPSSATWSDAQRGERQRPVWKGKRRGSWQGRGWRKERAAARSSPRPAAPHCYRSAVPAALLWHGSTAHVRLLWWRRREKSEGEEAAEGRGARGARCGGSGEAAAGLARGIGLLLPRSRLASTR